MTGRSVPEWIGKTPDTPVPPRVRLRVFEREGGKCHKCTRKIAAGEKWTCEHVKAVINGGANREANLACTCANCLPGKNAADVAEKAAVAKTRKAHLGIRRASRPIPGSRASGWKRHMDGTVTRRD